MTAIDRTRAPQQAMSRDYERPRVRETKPSIMTTEFWAMLAGIVAVVVIYIASADRSLNLFRASLLATIIAVGYFVSRGLAKSGSSDTTNNEHD